MGRRDRAQSDLGKPLGWKIQVLWDTGSRSWLDFESKLFVSERVGRAWAGSAGLRVEKLLPSPSAKCVPSGANPGLGLDFGEVSEVDGTWEPPGASWE